jgi:predicted RNA binding protein YcfA (HicA-like mRNA interferase family)
MTTTEAHVRAMTKRERVAYLQQHGWYRLSAHGSQTWFASGWQHISRQC